MKNLPDKIYLATTEKIQNLDNSFVGIAHRDPENIIEPIEYVRKDAFIENICEWLKEHVLEYVPEMNYGVGKTQPDYYTKNFIESLKKYINRL